MRLCLVFSPILCLQRRLYWHGFNRYFVFIFSLCREEGTDKRATFAWITGLAAKCWVRPSPTMHSHLVHGFQTKKSGFSHSPFCVLFIYSAILRGTTIFPVGLLLYLLCTLRGWDGTLPAVSFSEDLELHWRGGSSTVFSFGTSSST